MVYELPNGFNLSSYLRATLQILQCKIWKLIKNIFIFFTAIESLEHFDCFQMVEFFLIRRFYDLEG